MIRVISVFPRSPSNCLSKYPALLSPGFFGVILFISPRLYSDSSKNESAVSTLPRSPCRSVNTPIYCSGKRLAHAFNRVDLPIPCLPFTRDTLPRFFSENSRSCVILPPTSIYFRVCTSSASRCSLHSLSKRVSAFSASFTLLICSSTTLFRKSRAFSRKLSSSSGIHVLPASFVALFRCSFRLCALNSDLLSTSEAELSVSRIITSVCLPAPSWENSPRLISCSVMEPPKATRSE